jgi:TP901 family phage tail tape measure protein
MANEILVGLKIGATISGSLHAAFGSASTTLKALGRASDELTAKQARIGAALAASLATGEAGAGRLRRSYDQIGRTLDQLKTKQEALNASILRGQGLADQRKDLRGKVMETAGTAAVVGAPIYKALQAGITFQDEVRDIRITAGMDAAEEQRLAASIRQAAMDKNRFQSDINLGVNTMVAGGLDDLKALQGYIPVMAEVATATGASMEDLGKSTVALRNNMNIGDTDFKAAMNMLAAGGKTGQFELVDMAKWLPALTPQLQSLGMTGTSSLAEAVAHLQVARMGAGSSDEAANNYKNFLNKATAPDTLKAFEDAGIDLKTSLQLQVGKGVSPVTALLNTIRQHLGGRAEEASAGYQAALNIQDEGQRTQALQALDKSFKLGELFRDQQVAAFLRPALANLDKMKEIETEARRSAQEDVIGKDFALRMETPGSSIKAFQISLNEIGLTLSDALLPSVNELLKDVIPLVHQFAAWTKENPSLIKGIVGLVGGLLAGRMAFLALAYGVNLAISPIVAMRTGILTLSSKWTLLKALWQAGRFAPLVTGLTRVGSGLMFVTRITGLFLRGFGTAFGAPLLLAGRGLLFLGGILGGSLLNGLRLAGQAVLWLGRALLLNPIGLLITGLAVGAYLIYRYWEPIKGFFGGLWSEVRAGFAQGLGGIARTLLNFSPIGLLYRGFSALMNYLGVEMPGTLSELGGKAMSALAEAWSNMTSTVAEVAGQVWVGVRATFDNGLGDILRALLDFSPVGLFYQAFAAVLSYLGIELPGKLSELGAGLMTQLAEGILAKAAALRDAVLGIGRSIREALSLPDEQPKIGQAGATLTAPAGIARANRNALEQLKGRPASNSPVIQAGPLAMAPEPPPITQRRPALDSLATANARNVRGGDMSVQFNPTITLAPGSSEAQQVERALYAGFDEFERMMRRYEQRNARSQYGEMS